MATKPNTSSVEIKTICENILRQVKPQTAQGPGKRISAGLYEAIEEIISACQNNDQLRVLELLGIKTLIVSEESSNHTFWEENKTEPNLYDILDTLEGDLALALNKMPRGLIHIQGSQIQEAEAPQPRKDSRTLIKMALERKELEEKYFPTKGLLNCPKCNGQTELNGQGGIECHFCGYNSGTKLTKN